MDLPSLLGHDPRNGEELRSTRSHEPLENDINVIELGPQNHISKVILDGGIGQDLTISGFDANPTVEIKGDARTPMTI